MRIDKLEIAGFRNLKPTSFSPAAGINVIHGKNAQGKTNLIEAIWMCSGMKSFRGAKDAELRGFDSEFARIKLAFSDARRQNALEMRITERRTATLNGVELPSPAGLIGSFQAVVFSPAFLSIVQQGPAERRAFTDAAACQLKPALARRMTEYHRLLRQRAALLKDIPMETSLWDMLDVLDLRLAAAGEEITRERLSYLSLLTPFACEIYRGLSGGRETLSFQYIRKGAEDGAPLAELLRANRKTDIQNKSTAAGPHRDDIMIAIDGVSAREFGSQGQQRSAALAMKLAEASVIRELKGEEPVTLLDDVMSELDTGRQDYVLNHIGDRQVFITCCEPSAVLRLTDGKRIAMEDGRITEEN